MRGHTFLTFVSVGLGVGACGSVKVANDAAQVTDTNVIDSRPPDGPAAVTPQLHWTFDGNTNNTGSVNGYALTIPNGIGYVQGKVGMAASFAQAPLQYSYVDGMRGVLGGYAQVTIAFWLKEPGTVPSEAFFDCDNRSASPYGGIQLGLTQTSTSVCVSTTSNSYLGGSCAVFTAPGANNWHHWIIRYAGSGTGGGQGGPTEIYVDDRLALTVNNDAANNPVFSATGIADRLTIGGGFNMQMDDVKIYNRVFAVAEQCTEVIGGSYAGTTCTLP